MHSAEIRGMGRRSPKQREDIPTHAAAIDESFRMIDAETPVPPEAREVNQLVIQALRSHDLAAVTRLLEILVIPEDFFALPDIQAAALKEFKFLAPYKPTEAFRIADLFRLSPVEVDQIKEAVVKSQLRTEVQNWIHQKRLGITVPALTAPLNERFSKDLIKLCQELSLPDQQVGTLIEDMYIELMIESISASVGEERNLIIDGTQQFYQSFSAVDQLRPEAVKDGMIRAIERYLDADQIDQAVTFMYQLTIPHTWHTPAVRQAMAEHLSKIATSEQRSAQIGALFNKSWIES